MNYHIKEGDDRIVALTPSGVAICGAYRPEGHDYWSLYVTKLITDSTGLAVPPHREHFWGRQGHVVAKAWVELIAALYMNSNRQVVGGVA